MTGDAVRLTDVVSLSAAGAASTEAHGLARVDAVVPGGFYTRRRPACIDTVDLLPSEAVFRQYITSFVQGFGPLRRFVLQDALVTDQGALLTRGGVLVRESCWEFLAHGHVPYGLRREAADRFRRTADPDRVVEAPSLLLKRPWWRNYGHWLLDAAALIALLVSRGIGGFDQIVIGDTDDPKLRDIFGETLALVAPGVPIVEHPDNAMWMFSELHYVEPVRRPPMFTVPEAIEALRRAVLGEPPPPVGNRRLFASRRHWGRRSLANEAEVIAVCERHGFEVVYPEQHGLREQGTLFRSAAAVVGVKGAALANIAFSPPDGSVIALSPADFADPFFWDVAGSRQLAYSEIFGPLTTTARGQAQNPFTIDPGRLDALLRRALPTSGAVPAARPVPLASWPPASRVPTHAETAMSDSDALRPELTGEFYLSCLARIHEKLRPRTYLEIGTLAGSTLRLSRARSAAIDPAFQIAEPLPGSMPSLFLFQGSSDAFFETVDPRAVLGAAIDLAFLDGMHLFEFLLRDFMNTERHCHQGSTIILHDCVPLDRGMAGRDMIQAQTRPGSRYPGWWTGDVWKTVDILMRYRPDLDIIALDAPPTGLVVIRNLDPASTVLRSEYGQIVDAYASRQDFPAVADYLARLPLYDTAIVDRFAPLHGADEGPRDRDAAD